VDLQRLARLHRGVGEPGGLHRLLERAGLQALVGELLRLLLGGVGLIGDPRQFVLDRRAEAVAPTGGRLEPGEPGRPLR
jgi:hypothetical protein